MIKLKIWRWGNHPGLDGPTVITRAGSHWEDTATKSDVGKMHLNMGDWTMTSEFMQSLEARKSKEMEPPEGTYFCQHLHHSL